MDEEEELREHFNLYQRKINYLIGRANTKSKQRNLITSITGLQGIIDDKFLPIEGILDKSIDKITSMDEKYFAFNDSFSHYQELLKKISNNTIFDFDGVHYPFYQKYKYNSHLSFEKIYSLVLDFYKSFNDESINSFINKISENDIYLTDLHEYAGGLTTSLDVIKRYIILLDGGAYQNLFSASVLSHELGHAYEENLFYNTGDWFGILNADNTIFYEVSSSFFEYAFLQYLKENRLFSDVIDSIINNFYFSLFIHSFNLNILCSMKKMTFNGGNVLLNDKNVMDKAEIIKEKINYYQLLPNFNDEVTFSPEIIYFIGSLFAMYLYDSYKDNPKEFMKNFRTSLLSYSRNGEIGSFEGVGITEDKLLEGKVLRREIKKFIKDVKD